MCWTRARLPPSLQLYVFTAGIHVTHPFCLHRHEDELDGEGRSQLCLAAQGLSLDLCLASQHVWLPAVLGTPGPTAWGLGTNTTNLVTLHLAPLGGPD